MDIIKAFQIHTIKSKLMVRLDKVHIENKVFRLFSNFTSACILFCAVLITLRQLVGRHIECIPPPRDELNKRENKVMNQYCFITGTYTVPELYNMTVGLDIGHPGVGTYRFDPKSNSEQHYHMWYQWVPVALFFQGITFIAPHILWKALERGQIRGYCVLEWKYFQGNEAARYFVGNLSYNDVYAYSYVLCEFLNMAILILNFFWTNAFLGQNDFLRYGPEVVEYSMLEDTTGLISPQDRVFPKVSKCNFQKYGPSGGVVRYDIICVLAMNILNEKIYIFLWFWFVILFVLGCLAIFYRLAVLFLPGIRNLILRRRTPQKYINDLNYCLKEMNYADWFLLKKLRENINSNRFGHLIMGIKVELMMRKQHGHELPPYMTLLSAYTESDKDSNKDGDFDESPL